MINLLTHVRNKSGDYIFTKMRDVFDLIKTYNLAKDFAYYLDRKDVESVSKLLGEGNYELQTEIGLILTRPKTDYVAWLEYRCSQMPFKVRPSYELKFSEINKLPVAIFNLGLFPAVPTEELPNNCLGLEIDSNGNKITSIRITTEFSVGDFTCDDMYREDWSIYYPPEDYTLKKYLDKANGVKPDSVRNDLFLIFIEKLATFKERSACRTLMKYGKYPYLKDIDSGKIAEKDTFAYHLSMQIEKLKSNGVEKIDYNILEPFELDEKKYRVVVFDNGNFPENNSIKNKGKKIYMAIRTWPEGVYEIILGYF